MSKGKEKKKPKQKAIESALLKAKDSVEKIPKKK